MKAIKTSLGVSFAFVGASLATIFLVCWLIDPSKALLPTAFCAAMFGGALALQPENNFVAAVRLLLSAKYRLIPFAVVVGLMLTTGKGQPQEKVALSFMLFALFLFGSELTEMVQRRIVRERDRS